MNRKHRLTAGFLIVAALALPLAACGGSGAPSTASRASSASNSAGLANSSAAPYAPPALSKSSAQQAGSTQSSAPTGQTSYLSKTLSVDLAVKDTTATSRALQDWISSTDPKSMSIGMTYNQQSDNGYTIQMTYSVQATLYPQIEQYLAAYAASHGGKLLNLRESVQDLTNDYIDTQSRLTNLRAEQQRLLTLMSKAQALGDVLSINQQLTDVEGQIESLEAHQSALESEVTMYTVTINLMPLSTLAPAPIADTGWHPTQTLKDALAAALVVAQIVGSLLIWLAVFSLFLLPIALLWLVWRRVRGRRRAPSVAAPIESQS